MTTLFPVFLKLHSRRVLLVGGGRVAAGKLRALLDAGADVTVVAPSILEEIAAAPVSIARRAFSPKDLNGVWFVVAAGTPDVNREVALCAGQRGIFVNAVDDVQNASAYLGGVLRRDGVTVAVSTDGAAPALAGLLREGLDALLPADLSTWMTCARETRRRWLADRVPMPERRPRLLDALVSLYPGGQLGRRSAEREGGGARGPEGQGGDAPSAAPLIPRPPDSPAPRVPGSPAPRLPGSPAPWPPGPPAPRPPGFVAIVGAGPGDPELLTRRAASRLAAADLIVYDALVDPRTLELAPAAKRVFVGKRAGRPSVSQDFINRLLVRAARRGLTVVRLKGGDPFVFGRGGEEAMALAAAGIAFEVVPGVTSAVAAPALAGIPVTHRGLASGFVVVSGHAADAYRPVLESLAPQSATVVVLMGLRGAASIANLMIDRGWPSGTPVGVVLGGSTADAAAWTTTLAGLRHGIERGDRDGPGTIVIGQVVSLRGLLAALPAQRGSHGNNRTA